jgi:hypothetical protein
MLIFKKATYFISKAGNGFRKKAILKY